MKQYNKPRKSHALFSLGFLETIPSQRYGTISALEALRDALYKYTTTTTATTWLGFVAGIFLANHFASTDNLTRTTKRQNT